jgi:hypothetical protein
MKFTAVFILVFSLLVLYGCTETTTTTPPPSTTCDQPCKDKYSAKALSDLWVAVMNNNTGLRFTGNHDTIVEGPVSGSIHVFGSFTAHSNDSCSLNFTFAMTNAVVSSGDYNMTFDGDVAIYGTYSSNYREIFFQGSSVKFFGNILYSQTSVTVFEQSCEISVVETLVTRSGFICNRGFP